MDTRKDYGIRITVDLPFEMAVARTKESLKEQGFGVLSEIDMKEKFSEKLQVEIRPYVILGACNPPLAYKAMQAEPEIGLLLPCNVIVYENQEGRSVVSAVDPESMMSIAGGSAAVSEVAHDAKQRLHAAIQAIQ